MSDTFTEATELLLGDRPSHDEVQRAAELFQLASSQGHAEASERLAFFEAFGMMRPQSWDRALDFLELGACQGSQRAREQLLLISDSSQDASIPEDTNDDSWRGFRARVDVEARIAPGEKIVLSDSPRIRVIEQFATAAECRWIIASARPRLAPAAVFDEETGGQKKDASRDNSYLVLRIGEMNVLTEVIRHRISAATGLPVPLFEPSQVLHYSIGQRFKPHYDFLDPANPAYRDDLARFGQRVATFLIYLNDNYGGGETSFPEIGLDYRANAGDALFFASVTRDGRPDPTTLHAGLPPTSGEKWVFSQWIRGQFPSE
ncbi:MAG TPA: 2OG-Fe(II) oxygenase [Sphingomicrobium sp.]|nr:2OG-Fe(II) oxygenase [Sphingomicrobium sp.]